MAINLISALHEDGEQIVVASSLPKRSGAYHLHVVTSIADAAAWIDKERNGRNVYVRHAVHSGKTEKAGASNLIRPVTSIGEWTGSRSFMVDIDVGKEKFYVSLDAAKHAVKLALGELGRKGIAPPTMIQLSGGGMQLVWTLDRVVPAGEWVAASNALYALLAAAKLKTDPRVNMLDAGVRVCGPGYTNYNHGAPLPTQRLGIRARLDAVAFLHSLDPSINIHAKVMTDNAASVDEDEKFAVYKDEFVFDITKIVDHCIQVQDALATGGKDHTREHWLHMVSLCSKHGNAALGRAMAHLMSKAHSTYDADETDKKFDEFSKHKRPPFCKTLNGSNPGVCDSCKFKTLITTGKSPAKVQGMLMKDDVKAAVKAGPPVIRISTPPHEEPLVNGHASLGRLFHGSHYFNTDVGIQIQWQTEGENTASKMVWPNINVGNMMLHYVDGSRNHRLLSMDICHVADRNRPKSITLDINACVGVDATAKALARDYSELLPSKNVKEVHDAVASWVASLEQRQSHNTVYTKLGWSETNDLFVLGNTLYHTDGRQAKFLPSDEMELFNQHGSEADYAAVIQAVMAHEQRPEAHAYIAASLGAILLKLFGATGIAINLNSPTGYGKTTLTRIASSIWGPPKLLGMGVDDTDNALAKNLTRLNNLPAFYDEVKRDERELSNWINRLIFRLSGSTEKARLTANAQAQHRGQWQTFIQFATNYSFHDLARRNKNAADASVARIMDLHLDPLPQGSVSHVAAINSEIAKLEYINGHVGHKFVAIIVADLPTLVKRLQFMVTKLLTDVATDTTDVSSRNHANAGAAMIVAAAYAKQHNLLPLSPTLVREAVVKAMSVAKTAKTEASIETSPVTMLSNYLKETEDRRLTSVVNHATGTRKDFFGSTRPLVKTISYEVDLTGKSIFVDVGQFTTWLRASGAPYTNTLQALKALYPMDRRTLGHGIEGYSGIERAVFVLPPTGDFRGFFSTGSV